jgi:oligosaccharide reducing-end xylanase
MVLASALCAFLFCISPAEAVEVRAVMSLAQDGNLFVTWSSDIGPASYTLETTTNLTSPSWAPVAGSFWPTQATNWLGTASGAERYYRVKGLRYRNLFAEIGYSNSAITSKVNTAFQQLFHGNPSTQAIYFPAGTNANGALAYIYDVGNQDVRSEGMSYGMMIAVQLDKKSEFDAIWNWAKTCMFHSSPTHPAYQFFSWQMNTNGTPIDEMPAPDGEEYFAMSLYFAAGRWGNGTGIYNYRDQADQLLTNMVHRDWITGSTVQGSRKAGALFDTNSLMVRFTPVYPGDKTDPSYHLPAFYELWARWGTQADRSFWTAAAAASRSFFQNAAHPSTGLTPDYANFNGTPWAASWNSNSTNFIADAWRTAANWSVDWAWWGQDTGEQVLSDRLQAFFQSQGINTYGAQYTLSGIMLNSSHSTGLVAMNAAASLAATDSRATQFLNGLWNASIPSGTWRYYDGSLYLLGLLQCSGQFRIWSPQ